MNIQVTLEKEEFQPVLINLISKALNRTVSEGEIKSIRFELADGLASRMIAVVEPKQDANP